MPSLGTMMTRRFTSSSQGGCRRNLKNSAR
jgi:hypothetical protein